MSKKLALENLTDDGLFEYIVRHYDMSHVTTPSEFHAELETDMSHITHIKRLLLKHRRGSPLAVHLILNHVILLKNVLGAIPALKVILLKLDPEFWELVVPFFHFLSVCPQSITLRGSNLVLDKYLDTDVSRKILAELRMIGC